MKLKIIALGCAVASGAAVAGPDKIKFPSDYLRGVLYQTLDRPDNKQYRELYAPASAIEAVKKGQPIPYGTVLTLVQWSVEQDAQGNPLPSKGAQFALCRCGASANKPYCDGGHKKINFKS